MRLPAPLLLSITACASATVSNPPPAAKSVATSTSAHGSRTRSWSLPHIVVDGKTGAKLDPEAFYVELLSARVVYISEEHNNPHDHAAQLAMIAGLYARDRSIAIGMEMFKRPFQPAIDEYLAGTIDDAQLIERTEWEERWGYSFELYRPILEFARAHQIPVHALNAPDEITRAVATKGMEGLSDVERASLPDLDLGNEEHRELIRAAYSSHHGHASAASFENFYSAQVIWDETMAYEIARVLGAARAPHRVVVLAGDGHIRFGLGIPSRAARRGASPFRTVLPIMQRDLKDLISASAGDYLWVMAAREEDLGG